MQAPEADRKEVDCASFKALLSIIIDFAGFDRQGLFAGDVRFGAGVPLIMKVNLTVGNPAPEFSLPSLAGKQWTLSDLRGSVVALLFYPGNETLVCTKQLCSIRDNWDRYIATGAEIVGISPGSVDEHSAFAARHGLPLNLLADKGRLVTNLYAKHFLWPIWTTRGVVVIDAKGIVRFRDVVLRAFRPTDDEVLAEIHLARYDRLSQSTAPNSAD